jgi:hypothetical protein
MYKNMRKKLKEKECVVQDLKKKEKKMLQIAIMKKLLKNNEWNWEVEICRRGAGGSGCYWLLLQWGRAKHCLFWGNGKSLFL